MTIDPTSSATADPHGRDAETYPRLDPTVAERVAAYGTKEYLVRGETVIDRGQRGVDFFLVLEGAIEIFETDRDGGASIVTVHAEGQFTGEVDMLSDRAALVGARAATDSRVARLTPTQFRRLIGSEPDVAEVIMRAFILRRVGIIRDARGGVSLVGPGHSADTLRLQRFLTRNAYPHRLLDTEAGPEAGRLLNALHLSPDELPVVVGPDGRVYRNPSIASLADDLGLTDVIDPGHVFDVAVVGAGPAGLAAAVYAASEGLSTIVIEGTAPGGQAGTSSKIENYLGFPTGISGQALAGRAQVQARKFGARIAVSRDVVGIACEGRPFALRLDGGGLVSARAVVVATGARYRKLDVPDYDCFEGQGIHYAATAMEAHLCEGEEVVVVGGGNSAGQAAMFLSRTASHVHVLVRGEGLAATMSDYLVRRIEGSANVTLHARTEVTALAGDRYLRSVTWTHRDTGRSETHAVGNLFAMIGALPCTGWLAGCVDLDEAGFVRTGSVRGDALAASPFATSHPGLYAVGDVRSGSVKRVASGVGEGSVVIQAVHAFLNPTQR